MSWNHAFLSNPFGGGPYGENPRRETLPVLFRTEKVGQFKGHVTAVLPTLPGTGAHDFTVYAHVGQHSTGTMGWYYTTRPARPEEYASLLRELQSIYEHGEGAVKLRVVPRITQDMVRERRKNLTSY